MSQSYRKCFHCGGPYLEQMWRARNELWFLLGFHGTSRLLHLECFEQRIGRRIEVTDFDWIVPVNWMNEKLRDRFNFPETSIEWVKNNIEPLLVEDWRKEKQRANLARRLQSA